MDAVRRIQLIRIIEKIEKNLGFCKKLGIQNKSELKMIKKWK